MAILDSLNQIRHNGAGFLDPDIIFADIAARDALPSAKRVEGYLAIVQDADGNGNAGTFILSGGVANSNWTAVTGGGDSDVTSVNTQTGAVVLDTDDISEGTTNLYYTEARVTANTDVAANTTHRGTTTGNPHNVTITDVGGVAKPTGNSDTVVIAIANDGTESTVDLSTLTNIGVEFTTADETKLDAITNTGSGLIITDAERIAFNAKLDRPTLDTETIVATISSTGTVGSVHLDTLQAQPRAFYDIPNTPNSVTSGDVNIEAGGVVYIAPGEWYWNNTGEDSITVRGGVIVDNITDINPLGNPETAYGWISLGSMLSTEQVQDIVGGMVDGGTETNITVTYDDTTGKLNFVASGTGGGRGFSVDGTTVGGTGAVDFINDTTNVDANNRTIDFHSDNNNQITGTVSVAGLGGTVNTDNIPNNHIPANIGGEFHSSGIQLERPQLLSEANQQWFFVSQSAAIQYDFIAVDDTRGIQLDAGDSLSPNDSTNANYAFRDATGIADALLFRADTTAIANELAGETINTDRTIRALAIPINVSLFVRNSADNFVVLGPFTRYQWEPSAGSGTLKLLPADGSTLADIHQDGAGVLPDRDTITQSFGTFLAFIAQDTDFIRSVHKIRTPETVSTDADDVLTTKGYVGTTITAAISSSGSVPAPSNEVYEVLTAQADDTFDWNPVVTSLTTAQWEALPDAEKPDGRQFYLTDYVSEGQAAGTGGGGGTQFANQQALEDFISDKAGFRTDIGATNIQFANQGALESFITDDAAFRTAIGAGTGSGSGGLLPTTYNYSFNGGDVLGFLQEWDSGLGDITTGAGVAVTAGTLSNGDTVTIGDSDTGEIGIYRWVGSDFDYGTGLGGENPNDLILVYRFNDALTYPIKRNEQLIHSINGDTILTQSGVHLDGTGPTGGEIIKVSDTLALEQSIQRAYVRPSTNTIVIALLPDSAVLADGEWMLVDDQGSGNTTIAQFPDASTHSVVAGYGQVVGDFANPPAERWAGNITATRWNGREFYLTINVTEGISYITDRADAADQFGERPITGVSSITDIFRNVHTLGDVVTRGVWTRDANGALVLGTPIVADTLLGVVVVGQGGQLEYTAGGLQTAFADPAQQLGTTAIVSKLQDPITIEGFTVRNNEFYAVPNSLVRFHLLVTTNVPSTLSPNIWFDAIVRSVDNTTDPDLVDLRVEIVNLSEFLSNQAASFTYSNSSWLITLSNEVGILSRPQAGIADNIHISHLPTQTTISDLDTVFPTSGAVIDYVATQVASAGGGDVSYGSILTDSITENANVAMGSGNTTFNIGNPSDLLRDRYPLGSNVIINQGGTVATTEVTLNNNAILQFSLAGDTTSFTAADPASFTISLRSIPFAAIQFPDGTTQITAPASHPVSNIHSTFPVDQTTVTTTDTYEVSYTLENDVNAITVVIDGLRVHTVSGNEAELDAGDRSITFTLEDAEQANIANAGASVYEGSRYQLEVTFTDGSIHRFSVAFGAAASDTGDIYVIGGEFNNNGDLTLHRHGEDNVTISAPSHPLTNVFSNIPVDNSLIVQNPTEAYTINYTITGEAIQSGHVVLYGQNVQTLVDLGIGDHTLTISLTSQQAGDAAGSTSGQGTYTAPNFQLVARLAGETFDRRYSVAHTDGRIITGDDVYVDGGSTTANTLTLHRHGDSVVDVPITLEASAITNFNQAVLNIIGHDDTIPDWTYSISAQLDDTSATVGDRGTVQHQILTRLLTQWELGSAAGGAPASYTDTDGANPTVGPPASVIRHGDVIRAVNVPGGGQTGAFDATFIWEGADSVFGVISRFQVDDFVLASTHDAPLFPNNYVTAGSVSGTTLTLNREGLSDVTITGLPSGGSGTFTGGTVTGATTFQSDVTFDSTVTLPVNSNTATSVGQTIGVDANGVVVTVDGPIYAPNFRFAVSNTTVSETSFNFTIQVPVSELTLEQYNMFTTGVIIFGRSSSFDVVRFGVLGIPAFGSDGSIQLTSTSGTLNNGRFVDGDLAIGFMALDERIAVQFPDNTFQITAATNTVVDTTITDGGTNPVEGNAIFDALALKADSSQVLTNVPSGAVFTDTQLTSTNILGVLNGASGSIDGDLLGNAANTQLTSSTILGVLNAAAGSIDADLLGNAATTFSGGAVAGATTFQSNVIVEGTTTLESTATFQSNVTVDGMLTVMTDLAIGDFDLIPNASGEGITGTALVTHTDATFATHLLDPGRIDLFESTSALTAGMMYIIRIDDAGTNAAVNTGDLYRVVAPSVSSFGTSFSGAQLITNGNVGAEITFPDTNTSDVDVSIFAIGDGPITLAINNSTDTRVFNLHDSGDLEIDGGLVLTSPNGTRYRITVANNGNLTTTAV